jgi:hypothetical protein
MFQFYSLTAAYVFGTDNHYVSNSNNYPFMGFHYISTNPGHPYDYSNYSPKFYTDLEVGTRDKQNDRKFNVENSIIERKFTTHGTSNQWLPN